MATKGAPALVVAAGSGATGGGVATTARRSRVPASSSGNSCGSCFGRDMTQRLCRHACASLQSQVAVSILPGRALAPSAANHHLLERHPRCALELLLTNALSSAYVHRDLE